MQLNLLRHQLVMFFRYHRATRLFRWSWRALLIIFIMDSGYLIGIWPDWQLYSEGPIQSSNFIRTYVYQRYRQDDWPELFWKQTPITDISKHMIRALVIAEDARFYNHTGIDLDALQAAMQYNLSEKRFIYGASTISQQTVKNLFLNSSRNPLRKWHELALTLGMEAHLSKKRILELYLNVAEFGRGIYGVEAAARHYWGVSAAQLSKQQAIQLAASLSAPVKHNPVTRSRYFKKRVRQISRYF